MAVAAAAPRARFGFGSSLCVPLAYAFGDRTLAREEAEGGATSCQRARAPCSAAALRADEPRTRASPARSRGCDTHVGLGPWPPFAHSASPKRVTNVCVGGGALHCPLPGMRHGHACVPAVSMGELADLARPANMRPGAGPTLGRYAVQTLPSRYVHTHSARERTGAGRPRPLGARRRAPMHQGWDRGVEGAKEAIWRG